jgi:predicted phage tail protein
MTSDWSSKLGTSAMTRDVLSFLQNKITDSELAKDLLADIDSKAVAAEVDASIEDAKSEATAQVEAAKKEVSAPWMRRNHAERRHQAGSDGSGQGCC